VTSRCTWSARTSTRRSSRPTRRFDIPDSVIGFLHGELGDPPGGWPEPLRTKALAGRSEPKGVAELSDSDRRGLRDDPRRTLNRLLFAGPTKQFEEHRENYGDTSVLSSKEFFYGLEANVEHAVDLEPGVRLLIGLEAIGEADDRGMRTVMCTLNGQLRPVQIRDRAVAPTSPSRRRPTGPTTAMSPRRSRVWSPSRSPTATRWIPARPSPPSRR